MMLKQVVARSRRPKGAPDNWRPAVAKTDSYAVIRWVPGNAGRAVAVHVGTLDLRRPRVPAPILDKLLGDAERDEVVDKWRIICGAAAGEVYRRNATAAINTAVLRVGECVADKHLDQAAVDCITAAISKLTDLVVEAGFTLPPPEKRKRKPRVNGVCVNESAENQISMPLTGDE